MSGLALCTVRIGIAADAVSFVRSELEAIVARYAAEPARELREIVIMLRRVRDAWTWGGAVAGSIDVSDPRSVTGEGAPALVVALGMGLRGTISLPGPTATADELASALDAARSRPDGDVVLVEVAWDVTAGKAYVPAELHPLAASMGNHLMCAFCGRPFPGDQLTCPFCGGLAPRGQT